MKYRFDEERTFDTMHMNFSKQFNKIMQIMDKEPSQKLKCRCWKSKIKWKLVEIFRWSTTDQWEKKQSQQFRLKTLHLNKEGEDNLV